MPATNAVSERSFSALKRVKMYLRSTTGDSRLNHLMMLHVQKDRTDALTLVDVANNFVREKENRKQLFGKFSQTISQTSSLFRQSQHKRKIRDITRGIVHNYSDLTYAKRTEVCFTRGTEPGGGGSINNGLLAQSFSACHGPATQIPKMFSSLNSMKRYSAKVHKNLQVFGTNNITLYV